MATIAEVNDPESLPDLQTLDDRVQRLIRERNNIGPVNLRAEAEMEEVASRIASMEEERDDLLAAIAKLRSAIRQLNREGRERLFRSFAEVDSHFKTLFKQLFGGGNAELQLTEADDPLDAGLEIMASPPGKRLQSLSLLSGGEQALTALAIIFAVFLTDPAPICVLDEVDASLDDSNVVRFCDLLRDICIKTGHKVSCRNPPPDDNGAHGPAVRRNNGAAWRFKTGIGRPANSRTESVTPQWPDMGLTRTSLLPYFFIQNRASQTIPQCLSFPPQGKRIEGLTKAKPPTYVERGFRPKILRSLLRKHNGLLSLRGNSI